MIELLCDLNINGKPEPCGALVTLSNESEKLLVRKGQAKNVDKDINKNDNTSSGQLPDVDGSESGVESGKHSGRHANSTKVRRSGKNR